MIYLHTKSYISSFIGSLVIAIKRKVTVLTELRCCHFTKSNSKHAGKERFFI